MMTPLTDSEAFHRFLTDQLAGGGRGQTPEELLRLWRDEHREYEASIAALRKALADMENGDTGKPFDEFLDEFRKKHNLPQDA